MVKEIFARFEKIFATVRVRFAKKNSQREFLAQEKSASDECRKNRFDQHVKRNIGAATKDSVREFAKKIIITKKVVKLGAKNNAWGGGVCWFGKESRIPNR